MPFDLDVADRDYRQDLSPDELERLERRQAPARRATQPPTSLAAAVERLASEAGREATSEGAAPQTRTEFRRMAETPRGRRAGRGDRRAIPRQAGLDGPLG
jgi:hypothetical protein